MNKYLLKNAKIIDENGELKENINLYITNGKIQKLVNYENKECIKEYEEIDCTGFYITPSFVNLHTHSPMNIMKGIAEDISIDNWFNEKVFPYESKLEAEDVYWGGVIAAVEMINNGVTAFADHYFYQESVYKAIEDTGIRGDIAPTIFGLADDYKKQLKESVKFVEKYNGKNSKISVRLGPHAPYTCPGDILKEIIDSAKKLDVGIHLHVSETKNQVEESIRLTGKTPIEILYESGGFEVDVIIAHGLWTTKEDLKYINNNATFAFSPKTYMKLSMGEGNIYDLKNKLNYSFGTDGAASSNTLNPLEQARYFALNGKLLKCNASDFDILEIWKSLMNGHNAFKFNTGKIKEGYDADLLIWDLNSVNTSPIYNPLTSIIYSSDSNNIKYTMVQGEFLKYDGKLKADVPNIIEKVQHIQEKILLRGKGKSKVSYN
ncbi:amidohydrolase family protein [Sedimentibacter sp. MB31-C6]|uniref:amidohydrolase family protein n=1 Tax=Sedimentibacter sp. MB31-C6 TaxID=3109366 RepID=UPI002DDD3B92|nr:amidohydrolase family protein [Sedimentibacter sp. MB36-C1]WSI04760.1 amidohydrolase family protein [Sedimentibacter sp. MB36-C1]